jgi:hypothetical protein
LPSGKNGGLQRHQCTSYPMERFWYNYSMDEFIFRIGTFFVLIGTFLFIMFLASDFARQTNFDYFFLALMAIVAGWMMQKKKAPPPPSGRFGFFKKISGNAKVRREEKNKKPEEKKK